MAVCLYWLYILSVKVVLVVAVVTVIAVAAAALYIKLHDSAGTGINVYVELFAVCKDGSFSEIHCIEPKKYSIIKLFFTRTKKALKASSFIKAKRGLSI